MSTFKNIEITEDITGIIGDYVLEFIKNDYGMYRKWKSGFLECWGECDLVNGTASNVQLPISFIDASYSVIPAYRYAPGYGIIGLSMSVQRKTSSTFTVYGRTQTGETPSATLNIKYYAFGSYI